MSREIVQLKRTFICPCGFGVLRDDIPVGTSYIVDWETLEYGWTFRCGGCGNLFSTEVVMASSQVNPAADLAPLPAALFSDDVTVLS